MIGAARKQAVLNHITAGRPYTPAGKSIVAVGTTKVHVRYVSRPAPASRRYAYNINPNTLRADYELWICGDRDGWYLFPIDVIRGIYGDPAAYTDARHPDLRVASVDVRSDQVTFGAGGKGLSAAAYRDAVLP